MKDIDKIVSRVQKLFELAGNNPSREEAIAASLKAQELMSKYGLSEEEINLGVEEEVIETMCFMAKGYGSFKYNLAKIIAANFGCKFSLAGKSFAVFYGYERNTIAAKMTFQYLFKICHTQGLKLSDHMAYANKTCKGVYANYTFGFVEGVKVELERQCHALQIVVPAKVEEVFENIHVDGKFSKINVPSNLTNTTNDYVTGMKDGRHAVVSRRIKEKE